jgi:hypothetical protein
LKIVGFLNKAGRAGVVSWIVFELQLIEQFTVRLEKEASLDKQAKERPSLFQMAGGSREEDEIDDGGNICITPSSNTRPSRTWK